MHCYRGLRSADPEARFPRSALEREIYSRGPQNAEAVLGIMVRHALDETGKNFLRLILGRVFHGRCVRTTSFTHTILLKPAIGRQHWSRDLAPRFKLFQRNPDSAICSIVEPRKIIATCAF